MMIMDHPGTRVPAPRFFIRSKARYCVNTAPCYACAVSLGYRGG